VIILRGLNSKKKMLSVMILALLTISFIMTYNTLETRKENKKSMMNIRLKDVARNEIKHPSIFNSNFSMIKVYLHNGSILSFDTLDRAVLAIYRAIRRNHFTLADISNITIVPFNNVLLLMKRNITAINESYYCSAYSLFFSVLMSPEKYNYSGHIVAIPENDFLYNTYGDKLTKTFLYGKIPRLNITQENANFTINENDVIMLRYLNLSEEDFSLPLIEELVKLYELISNYGYANRVKIIVVDISNSINNSKLSKKYPDIIFVKDLDTSILYNKSGTFRCFGFSRYPATVYLRGDLLIWRKTIGVEKTSNIIDYLLTILERGDMGIFSYIVRDVLAWDLIETKRADIALYIADGFGNVTVQLNYTILDTKNVTMDTDILKENISIQKVLYFHIDLPNNSRILKISIQVIRDNSVEATLSLIYTIEEIKKPKKAKEQFPWLETIGILSIVISVIVLGYYAYKRTERRRPKVKRVRRK